MALAYSILLVPQPCCVSAVATGRLDHFFCVFFVPKDSGVLKFDGTLVVQMIAWNGLIFRVGMANAWAGTVKRFLFIYQGQMCQ
jgi:hypothetical protein